MGVFKQTLVIVELLSNLHLSTLFPHTCLTLDILNKIFLSSICNTPYDFASCTQCCMQLHRRHPSIYFQFGFG